MDREAVAQTVKDPYRLACKVLEDHGFRIVSRRVGKHYVVKTDPPGTFVIPLSPSDDRWLLNFRADARRAVKELATKAPKPA